MKTTEELIKEGVEYFNKTGKHLYSSMNPEGEHVEYYYVYTANKDGVDYEVKIRFNIDDYVRARYFRIDKFPCHKVEHSQRCFHFYENFKSVKQNKYLKNVLNLIKKYVEKNIDTSTYCHNTEYKAVMDNKIK